MIRKHTLYSLAILGWALITFGLLVGIVSGQLAPIVTPAHLPVNGPLGMVGTGGVILVVGALVIKQLEKRSWRRAGRQADLSPAGTSLLGYGDLAGSVNGRTVRARSVAVDEGGGGEDGGGKTTYTVVEADLAGEPTDGLIIGPVDGNSSEPDLMDFNLPSSTAVLDGFSVLGPETLARDVLTVRAQNALDEPDRLDSVMVGDAMGLLTGDAGGGSIMGRFIEGLQARSPDLGFGNSDTARVVTEGIIHDGEELRAQVDAVAAVADAFDTATDDGRG